MQFTKLGAEVFRNYSTDGVPASGAWEPVKSDIRGWMITVEAAIGGVSSNGIDPALEVYCDDGVTQANITATTYGVNGGGIFHGRHARGTKASPTASQASDIIGGIGGRAYHSGSAFQTSSPASIHWQVTENQTGSAFGMWLRFLTTPKGSTTRVERGGVTDNGAFYNHDATGTFDPTSSTQTMPFSSAVWHGFLTAGVSNACYVAVNYAASSTSSGFRGGAARGTPASPTASQADDLLCFMGGHGYGATAFSVGSKALLGLKAAEAWSDSVQGTYITIETTPIGSTTRAERVRVTDVGNVKVGGTASRGTTEGTNQVVIFNGTAPAGTLTNGASFYAASGEMRVMDAAGNSTLLSPHDKATNEWIYDSVDTRTGKHLRIDMERLLRAINDKFGWDFIHEFVEDKA